MMVVRPSQSQWSETQRQLAAWRGAPAPASSPTRMPTPGNRGSMVLKPTAAQRDGAGESALPASRTARNSPSAMWLS